MVDHAALSTPQLIARARKAAGAIYLATDEIVAADIEGILLALVARLEEKKNANN